jgi:hypothetical protein
MRDCREDSPYYQRQAVKCFTHKNTYRYIYVLQKFVRSYNDSIHSATVMAPSKVGDSDILAICTKMRAIQSKIRRALAKFRAWQHVRISKQKLKFAKGGEQNYTTEILNVHKVVHKTRRPVYELKDLLGTYIGQFYSEELSPVSISERTTYKIDKILKKRLQRGIQE